MNAPMTTASTEIETAICFFVARFRMEALSLFAEIALLFDPSGFFTPARRAREGRTES